MMKMFKVLVFAVKREITYRRIEDQKKIQGKEKKDNGNKIFLVENLGENKTQFYPISFFSRNDFLLTD